MPHHISSTHVLGEAFTCPKAASQAEVSHRRPAVNSRRSSKVQSERQRELFNTHANLPKSAPIEHYKGHAYPHRHEAVRHDKNHQTKCVLCVPGQTVLPQDGRHEHRRYNDLEQHAHAQQRYFPVQQTKCPRKNVAYFKQDELQHGSTSP
jgi:hypothetical protein